MNKIYEELLIFIGQSVITCTELDGHLVGGDRLMILKANNPVTNMTIEIDREILNFAHNNRVMTNYNVIYHDRYIKLSEEEKKQLFDTANKRYLTHFKNRSGQESKLCMKQLIKDNCR